MNLNIGCGKRLLAGFLNIDLCPLEVPCPDGATFLQHDVREGLPCADGTVSVIVLRETFEHFTYPEGMALLCECRRVLRVGGYVEGLVPDMEMWMRLLVRDEPWPASLKPMPGPFAATRENVLAHLLYGYQDRPGMEHKSAYTHAMLRQVCALAGLDAVTWNEAEYEGVGLYFRATKPETPCASA